MSCVKVPITDDKATRLYNKLVELCEEVNRLKVVNEKVNPDDLVCNSIEEVAMLLGFRRKTILAKKDKFMAYHDKVFKSSFY